MTIDVSPEVEAQLRDKARAEGLSIAAYVERLVSEESSRHIRLAAFRQALDERLQSLKRGEVKDGEEVMARVMADLSEPGSPRVAR
jgi:hypothetical protein